MAIELRPSPAIWGYYQEAGGSQQITAELISSSIADKIAGYHISYSAAVLLEDLKLLTPKGNPNKAGKEVMASYIHWRYHHGAGDEHVKIVPPKQENTRGKDENKR